MIDDFEYIAITYKKYKKVKLKDYLTLQDIMAQGIEKSSATLMYSHKTGYLINKDEGRIYFPVIHDWYYIRSNSYEYITTIKKKFKYILNIKDNNVND